MFGVPVITLIMKKIATNIAIMLVSIFISLFVLEIAARQIINPIDVLLPIMEHDKDLGHRILANTGGHDALGFRNKEFPRTANIVAIGDSMTYGISATHKGAWPTQLQKLTGQTVYNMALGGYGPVQYLHLLKTKTDNFKPEKIIVAIYLGNDLFDVYNMTKGEKRITNVFIEDESEQKMLGGLRNMLSENSVVYRVITQSSLFSFVRKYEVTSDPEKLFIDGHKLDPKHMLKFMDIDSAEIGSALKQLETILTEMASYADRSGADLHFLIIPTKETVLFPQVTAKLSKDDQLIFEKLVDVETRILSKIRDFASRNSIQSINVLPVLRKASEKGLAIYPFNDGHPNELGYGLIAQAVNEKISGR